MIIRVSPFVANRRSFAFEVPSHCPVGAEPSVPLLEVMAFPVVIQPLPPPPAATIAAKLACSSRPSLLAIRTRSYAPVPELRAVAKVPIVTVEPLLPIVVVPLPVALILIVPRNVDVEPLPPMLIGSVLLPVFRFIGPPLTVMFCVEIVVVEFEFPMTVACVPVALMEIGPRIVACPVVPSMTKLTPPLVAPMDKVLPPETVMLVGSVRAPPSLKVLVPDSVRPFVA